MSQNGCLESHLFKEGLGCQVLEHLTVVVECITECIYHYAFHGKLRCGFLSRHDLTDDPSSPFYYGLVKIQNRSADDETFFYWKT